MGANSYRNIVQVQVTPTIAAAAYADGDMLHTGVIRLPNILKDKNTGEIVSAVIVDLGKQKSVLSLELFSREITGGTLTINDPLDISDTEAAYHLGSIPVAAADYKDFADNAIATVRNIGLAVKAYPSSGKSRDLYMAVVSRGTPTYTSVADIIVSLFCKAD